MERSVKQICDYGCEQEANYTFGNGRGCCESHFNRCPGTKKRTLETLTDKFKDLPQHTLKREVDTGKLKCFMCGKVAKHVVKSKINGFQPCCTENMMNCTGYGEYNGELRRKQYESDPNYGKNMSKAMTEVHNRPEVKEAKSSAMETLHTHNDEFKKNYKKGMKKAKKTKNTPEYKEACSIRFKEMFKDPEIKAKWVASNATKNMNNEEERLYNLLQSIYPSYFKFNYGDKFRVGRLAPDFYNERDKVAIESFGTYWHTKAMISKGMTKRQYVNDRIKKFKFRGWKLLCIWTSIEFKRPSTLTKKISKFMGVK